MIFCPKCGNQNNDGAAFCGECGAALKAAPAQVDGAPAAEAPVQAAPVNATEPMPAAAAEPTGVGAPAAAPAAAPAPEAAPAGAPVGAPVAAKSTNKLPIIIGAAVVIIAAILLIVLLVIPRCSGGVNASGVNMKTLVNGTTTEAQAELSKMKKAEIDTGSGATLNVYTSSDKMTSFVNDLFDSAGNGDISSWGDIMDSTKAKDLNGEWMLVSTADEALQPIIDMANEQVEGYDLGHMAIFATVVSDADLSNEEVAKLVSGAGLPYEHATVSDYSMDALMKYFVNYMGMAMAMSGNGMGSSSKYVDRYMSQIEDTLDQFGITRAGTGVYLAKDTYAVSVSAQFDGYAVVMLFAFNPNDFGMGDLLGEDFVNRMYVK